MNLNSKKIGISGGSGFLGRRIVDELQKKGAEVVAPRSSEYNFTLEKDTERFFVSHNLDMFVHSAALYGGLGINEKMPAHIFNYNMQMLLNIFKHSINYSLGSEGKGIPRIEKMISISSACGYPSKWGDNMREEFLWEGELDKSVLNYGMVKKLMETLGHVYRNQHELHSITLPLATLYGENDTFNPFRSHVPAALIRKFVEAEQKKEPFVNLWGTPDSVREFMYVGDAAKGIVLAIEKFDGIDNVGYSSKYTLNIGSGEGITIDYLATTIKDIIGYKGDIIYNGKSPGQKSKALVVERMEKVLNWHPQTSLRDGLEKTINWYVKNKEKADEKF
ncbi:MAG: NAD-dependent epimerase/dehydratase family protein [Candidatus Pacearchaeota archaeon]|jgi:GDP-L-fucose synthase